MGRRRLLGLTALGGFSLLAGCGTSAQGERGAASASPSPVGPLTPDRALAALVDGNRRFVTGKPVRSHSVSEAKGLAGGQEPFACVLACADSRVAPEALFDQGLGDLFVVRTAGQVADRAVVGSIEYAVEHLAVPLMVVLGHERCGAVKAAVAAHEKGETAHGDLAYLVDQIEPVVGEAGKRGGDVIDEAVRLNVERVVAQLGKVPVVADHVEQGELRVVGARYDLDEARVQFLP
jgi:carbonic anhydrase